MNNDLAVYEKVLVIGGALDGTFHQVPDGIVKMVNGGQAYTRLKMGVGGSHPCSVFIPEDQQDKTIAAVITALIKGYKKHE